MAGEDARLDEQRLLRRVSTPNNQGSFASSRGAQGASGSRGAEKEERNPIRGSTSQISATSSSVMILPADPHRTFLYLSNDNTAAFAKVSFGTDATLVTGIRLAAGGGGILLDNGVPTSAVFIIGSIANNPDITMVVG